MHVNKQTKWCLICGLIDNELILTKMNQGERKKCLGEDLDEKEAAKEFKSAMLMLHTSIG